MEHPSRCRDSRVGTPVRATCRITADSKLGLKGSGPLELLYTVPTESGSARGEKQAQLEKPTPKVRVPLPPPSASPCAPSSTQRLPRAAAAPAAQKQSPRHRSHRRAPRLRSATPVPMLRAPLSIRSSSTPWKSARNDGREPTPVGFPGGGGLWRVSFSPPPLPTATEQG